ncbi:hypothetical protein DCC85_11800 [Paenibacillus sp. CAA11]|nr:hypothetical protein DCC85_11800 [Paenibacillus sp. CAA11]
MVTSCFTIVLLSGCTFIQDPKQLISPPLLSSDKESLKSVVNAYLSRLPNGGSIIKPRELGDASSIRVRDLDNDGKSEAVVFYETPDDAVRIHGVIFTTEGDTWTAVTNFDVEGQVLESVDLRDLKNDGKTEIVVGYSNSDKQVQQGLTIYSFHNKTVEKALVLPYTHYVIDDLNGDGQMDISILTFQKNEYSTLTTYQYKDGSFVQLDQLELDANVNDYYNVVSGRISEGKQRGIILDASLAQHSAYSILVVMEKGKLVQKLSQDAALKDFIISSGDVNRDGILEIGIQQKPQGWDGFSFDDIPWFFSYFQYDEKQGLKFVMQQYMDQEGRFYYTFPSELNGNITVDTKSEKDQYLKFVRIDNGETVTEIKFFTLSQWDRAREDWKELSRTNDKVIGYRSKYELKVGKSEKEVKR